MAGDNGKSSSGGKKTFGEKVTTFCNDFGTFMWNSETKQFMGRTAGSWAKIGVFYLIFYGCLAGFFAGMLAVFLSTLNKPSEGGPKLTQFIANQPGLSRVGNLPNNYDSTNDDVIVAYANATRDFLAAYNTSDHSGEACPLDSKTGMPEGKACVFDTSLLGDCDGSDATFGLKDKKPCIFLRINKVYDWVPSSETGYLTLDCDNKAVATVYPSEGFLIGAFPYRGQAGYQSPIVAVKVDVSAKAQTVHCQLKGKDIKVSESYKAGRSYGKIRLENVSSKK